MFSVVNAVTFTVSKTLIKITQEVSVFNVTMLTLTATVNNKVMHSILLKCFPPGSLHGVMCMAIIVSMAVVMFVVCGDHCHGRTVNPHDQTDCLLTSTIKLTSFAMAKTSTKFGLCPRLPVFVILLKAVATIKNNVVQSVLTRQVPSILGRSICTLPDIVKNVICCLVIVSG